MEEMRKKAFDSGSELAKVLTERVAAGHEAQRAEVNKALLASQRAESELRAVLHVATKPAKRPGENRADYRKRVHGDSETK